MGDIKNNVDSINIKEQERDQNKKDEELVKTMIAYSLGIFNNSKKHNCE